MEKLEKIWELISAFFTGILGGFERLVTRIFGSSNEKMVKKLQEKVEIINELEPKYEAMGDEELRQQTDLFRERLKNGESLDDILVEAFAVCREGGKRYLDMRHYDVQLVGGMVLHSGAIGEMVTGEGKTLVATLPTYLNAIERKGVHVVTVNDYLARRDMEWMAPLYMGLGLTVGAIQGDMDVGERQAAYACDITYGTNNEFGFDYLRDNMRSAARGDGRFPKHRQQSQGKLNFAVIDEVDNILIDEARTPLIISGPANSKKVRYKEADKIARQLKKETHFKVNEKDHNVTLTDEGVREAERLAGVDTFYTAGNMDWPHHIDNALKAHHLYKKDVNYVVEEGKIVIVDEFTGRKMDGRQWSDGLHQAVEAKENVEIKEETQTLATITLQNYFKLYSKVSGMTGTAATEATEFWKIYKLDVIAIPTNRSMQRIEYPDVIYASEDAKYKALANDVERVNKWDEVELKKESVVGLIESENDESVVIKPVEGSKSRTISTSEVVKVHHRARPILVGTTSIEKSEKLSHLLTLRGIKHDLLNAKQHKREAEIVAQAGRRGMVTIATNMAGRGTDIVLGGNPETMAWARLQHQYATRLDVPREEWDALTDEIDKEYSMKEEGEFIKGIGGLHVIGTERHEARRIDLQLRGRCGRQGDPGSSRFYLSLGDDLMRIMAGPWVKKWLSMMGFKDDEAIENSMIMRRITTAQKKIEERNFEIRKNLLEYDEVMDEQRKRVYRYRQNILDGANCRELILEMIEDRIDSNLVSYFDRYFSAQFFAGWASRELKTPPLDYKMFRGVSADSAIEEAKDAAKRAAESDIIAKIEENLPQGSGDEEEDIQKDWNWEAIARFANTRFDCNLRDRDLKKVGADDIAEHLIERAHAFIDAVDLEESQEILKDDFGPSRAIQWLKANFDIDVQFSDIKNQEVEDVKALFIQKAVNKYNEREAEYPVMAGIMRFATSSSRVDREGLVAWAAERFEAEVSGEDIKNKQREELRDLLIAVSRDHQQVAQGIHGELKEKLQSLEDTGDIPLANSNGAVSTFSQWLKSSVDFEMPVDEYEDLESEELGQRLSGVVDERFHPEMRRMERIVLLNIVDNAWKEHLLQMDYLRSAVGQRGLAAVDPKVEYKREGMRMFEDLWTSIGEQTTDLIFKMEQLDEDFVSETWVNAQATQQEAASLSSMSNDPEMQTSSSQSADTKIEPIRNRVQKTGRNDPCPCGSGKKYKQCCLKKVS